MSTHPAINTVKLTKKDQNSHWGKWRNVRSILSAIVLVAMLLAAISFSQPVRAEDSNTWAGITDSADCMIKVYDPAVSDWDSASVK